MTSSSACILINSSSACSTAVKQEASFNKVATHNHNYSCSTFAREQCLAWERCSMLEGISWQDFMSVDLFSYLQWSCCLCQAARCGLYCCLRSSEPSPLPAENALCEESACLRLKDSVQTYAPTLWCQIVPPLLLNLPCRRIHPWLLFSCSSGSAEMQHCQIRCPVYTLEELFGNHCTIKAFKDSPEHLILSASGRKVRGCLLRRPIHVGVISRLLLLIFLRTILLNLTLSRFSLCSCQDLSAKIGFQHCASFLQACSIFNTIRTVLSSCVWSERSMYTDTFSLMKEQGKDWKLKSDSNASTSLRKSCQSNDSPFIMTAWAIQSGSLLQYLLRCHSCLKQQARFLFSSVL